MGLDMYLHGATYFYDKSAKQTKVHIFELGYWRKHPDLHGYIVQEFADGEDNCSRIDLSVKDMRQIVNAIKEDKLPYTDGFFFGESSNDDEQKTEAIDIFECAIKWLALAEDSPHAWQQVYYQASW